MPGSFIMPLNRKGTLCLLLMFMFIFSCKKNHDTNKSPSQPDPPNEPGTPGNAASEYFLYGSNMAWYPGWSDEQIAEILVGNTSKSITGAGVNSLRPAMYEYFVEEWGYDVRRDAFAFYDQLGAKSNTLFIGYPSEAHRDKTKYCSSAESKIFANLYEPIWATPGAINQNNYYAKYVYNLVKTYGSYVKYWEVWNEPDYTYNWNASQAWATTNPNPCDLPNLNAPIQSYIRMLRITHEVVKSFDKNDFVCVGGLGYEGFLDAILRNTDNPDGGKVASGYSEKGGAWFDCVSFHIYPMYWGVKNSDAAAATLVTLKNSFENVLIKYSQAGKKRYLITEANIPRKSFDNMIGSDEAQRNFVIKAAIASQKAGLKGMYIYGVADNSSATGPYDFMGFYRPVNSAPYNVTANSMATAYKTMSDLLKDRTYNKEATNALQLPANIDGAAFYSSVKKDNIYVLWAKTDGNSESSSATYTFPAALKIQSATIYSWDRKSNTITSSLNLTGSPVFVKPQ